MSTINCCIIIIQPALRLVQYLVGQCILYRLEWPNLVWWRWWSSSASFAFSASSASSASSSSSTTKRLSGLLYAGFFQQKFVDEEKNLAFSFAILGILSLTWSLQSTLFQNLRGVPWAWQMTDKGQIKDNPLWKFGFPLKARLAYELPKCALFLYIICMIVWMLLHISSHLGDSRHTDMKCFTDRRL